MKLYSLSSEQLNEQLTAAMQATITALARDGLIDEVKGAAWRDDHACMLMDTEGLFRRWLKKYMPDLKDSHSVVVVVAPQPSTAR